MSCAFGNWSLSDKVSFKCMLESQKMLSVNQTHAQIKILEIWKAVNVENYPNRVTTIRHENTDRTTRGMSNGFLQENKTPKTCIGDKTMEQSTRVNKISIFSN